LYHGPLPEIKEEIPMTDKSNNQKLTDYLNSFENPRAMLAALYVVLSALKGNYDAATPEVIRGILKNQEKGGHEA